MANWLSIVKMPPKSMKDFFAKVSRDNVKNKEGKELRAKENLLV
jgi:hypothetical protein